MCLERISKDFTANNMKKTGLNGYVYEFGVVYNFIDTNNIIDIHKYLMKKHKIMFRIIKKIFIVLLASIVNAF